MKYRLIDLLIAYRQAKTAWFYQKQLGAIRWARFEDQLDQELHVLRELLNASGELDVIDPGEVLWSPKSATPVDDPKVEGLPTIVPLSPRASADSSRVRLRLRLQVALNPAFAVIEVLWLRQFGILWDSMLAPQVVGNRMRRVSAMHASPLGDRDLFRFWPKQYRRHIDRPYAMAERLLAQQQGREHSVEPGGAQNVVIATADISAFYDNVSPKFLLSGSALAELGAAAREQGVRFDGVEYQRLTRFLIASFARWRAAALDSIGANGPCDVGLPIGALTSPVIANVALRALDTELGARHEGRYSRYVDDVTIVTTATDNDVSVDGIRAFVERVLPVEAPNLDQAELVLTAHDAAPSRLTLQRDKFRVLVFNRAGGKSDLRTMRSELTARGSEWRWLAAPARMSRGSEWALTAAEAQTATKPREVDALRLRRLEVSHKLRRLRWRLRFLDHGAAKWLIDRELAGLTRQVLRAADWPDEVSTAVRIVSTFAAFSMHDWSERLRSRLLSRLVHSEPWYGDGPIDVERARDHARSYLDRLITEAIARATPLVHDDYPVHETDVVALSRAGLRENRTGHDSIAPLRIIGETARFSALPTVRLVGQNWRVLDRLAADGDEPSEGRLTEPMVTWLRGGVLRAITAPRPLSELEATSFAVSAANSTQLREALSASGALMSLLRGKPNAEIVGADVQVRQPPSPVRVVKVQPSNRGRGDKRVVLGELSLRDAYYEYQLGRASGGAVGTPADYRVLNDVLDAISRSVDSAAQLRSKHRDDLVVLVLPELAVPSVGLFALLERCIQLEICVSAGLAYAPFFSPRREVANRAILLASFPYSSGFACDYYKSYPARGRPKSVCEATELAKASVALGSPTHSRTVVLDLIDAGRFSVLICSQLLEIDLRASLAQHVDAVFVPSWNRDTSTFDMMAQSAVRDLMAYVVIVNTGVYSNSFVMGPYQKPHERVRFRVFAPEVEFFGNTVLDVPIGPFGPDGNELRPCFRKDRKGDLIARPPNWP